jgi:putative ABC transport system ATP-binding protein
MTMTPLIEVRDFARTYGEGESATHALRGVSFSVYTGEFVAIMGPSGSGKSTLLHLLSFLDRASAGTYRYKGEETTGFDDEQLADIRKNELGFVFQQFNLMPSASVFENIMLPLTYTHIKHAERVRMTENVIRRVGLEHRRNHAANKLSGGEKQRVAFGRALVMEPSLILADEPTGNLDSVSGAQIMAFLQQLNDEGHTVLLVTHETETAQHAKRMIKMRDGAIESDEPIRNQFRADGQHLNK